MTEETVFGGKYRILRSIGVGGMGTVYEAEHVEIHRKVAIKLLHAEFAQNADAVARFRREAQIAGSLGHDSICEVLDVGISPDGSHYLVMPLLRGTSLAHLLAQTGQMAQARALDVVAQILGALEAAHAAGIVHRDLKPENVFITKVGDRDDFVKVLDFGISKVVQGGSVPTSMTRTGTVMGTPYYMSPEQARGQKDQDHRVDIYAAGVILYELLTAQRPFDGETFNELIIKIVTEAFAPVSTLRPAVSPQVESIVIRSMMRDREERYQTAAAMRADILAVRAGLADSVPGTRMVPTFRGDARTGSTALSQSRPQAPTDSHALPMRTGRGVLIGAAAGGIILVGGLVGFFAFAGSDAAQPLPATTVPMGLQFPMTVAPVLTAAPLVAATTAPETGLAPPETGSPEPQTASGSASSRRRRGEAGAPIAATAAPSTAAPAPQTSEPARTARPRTIRGAGGTKIMTENE